MALNQPKKVEERPGSQFALPVAADVTIYQGALTMLKAALARPAAEQSTSTLAAGCLAWGIAEKTVTGGAADGAVNVPVRQGVFLFKNSAGADEITAADRDQPAYVVDDETVAKTSNTNVRPKAGTIVDVESAGVWVRVGG